MNYRLWFIEFAGAWAVLGAIYLLWDWGPAWVAFIGFPIFMIFLLRATARSIAALRSRHIKTSEGEV